jgi:hypothetical protein
LVFPSSPSPPRLATLFFSSPHKTLPHPPPHKTLPHPPPLMPPTTNSSARMFPSMCVCTRGASACVRVGIGMKKRRGHCPLPPPLLMCMLALALFSTQPPGPPHTLLSHLSLAPTSLHFGSGPALSVPRGITSPLATSPPTAASTPAASRPDSGTEASTPLSYRAWAAGATPSASRTSRGKPGLACLRWAKWAARKSLDDGERGEMEGGHGWG